MQGLALQVQEGLKRDPHSGDLFMGLQGIEWTIWGVIAAEMPVDRDFLGFEGGSILAC
jgi:hypothetical protein